MKLLFKYSASIFPTLFVQFSNSFILKNTLGFYLQESALEIFLSKRTSRRYRDLNHENFHKVLSFSFINIISSEERAWRIQCCTASNIKLSNESNRRVMSCSVKEKQPIVSISTRPLRIKCRVNYLNWPQLMLLIQWNILCRRYHAKTSNSLESRYYLLAEPSSRKRRYRQPVGLKPISINSSTTKIVLESEIVEVYE